MAEEVRTARVIAQALDLQSALGQHTAALVRVLRDAGWSVELDVQDQRGASNDLQSLLVSSNTPALANIQPELTILEYPIWFPHAERFRDVSGTAVFWYHGVTPPDLWGDAAGRDILRRSEAGTELAWHAHLAIADSPFIAEELQHHSEYPAERIRVVPIGVDLAKARQAPSETDLAILRNRWGLNGRRVLLYVGRVAGNKGLDMVVETLALLADRYVDLHLLIVGDHSSMPAYRDLTVQLRGQAARRGVGDRITFTGRVESTQPFYHLAEVCVLASQHEGFGVPLIEAIAAGVPVVASASGAMPWVLGADEAGGEPAGLLCAAGDADDLAAKISQILDDGSCRAILTEMGHRRAEYFSIEQFNLRTRNVLAEAELLARQGPPPAAGRPVSPLYEQADVALREYRVRSDVPLFGPLIEWWRVNSTTHIKEAYLDRIIEQQVLFNRELVGEIVRLQTEVNDLRDQLSQLMKRETSS